MLNLRLLLVLVLLVVLMVVNVVVVEYLVIVVWIYANILDLLLSVEGGPEDIIDTERILAGRVRRRSCW